MSTHERIPYFNLVSSLATEWSIRKNVQYIEGRERGFIILLFQLEKAIWFKPWTSGDYKARFKSFTKHSIPERTSMKI